MIDLHCHILPGVDDGAKDMTDSLDMARAAEQEGIDLIIATPHHQNGKYINEKDTVLDHTAALNNQLKAAGINVTIRPGQEVRLYGELLDDWKDGKLLTVSDAGHMLVEFPSGSIPAFAEQMLFDMQLNGITPIIVHPERNAAIMDNPDKLYKLIKNGALSQVTAASINGQFGKKIQQLSMQLVEANLAHFLATDAHNTTSRGFGLARAYDELGADWAAYFQENADAIRNGEHIAKEPPQHVARRKKFLGLF